MPIPLNFLKAIAKAIVKYGGNAVGFGIAGDLLVDFGFPIVEDIWDAWGKKKQDEELRTEIEAVAQATAKEVIQQGTIFVQEVAGDQPPDFQQVLLTYLTHVPAMIRRSQRRQSDPTGRSVSANRIPRKAEDLLAFLPPKLPRFKPGDRPLPGVDWELETLLGVGGFGEVWKARNPHFDGVAPVALKFCLDSKAKDQLLRHEAVILNQVMRQGKHPGIVHLLHTYLSADPPCLAYEYIEDGDLAGIIKERKPKADTAAKIMLRLAEIVGFAHHLNPPVVHRDLKPANILVRQNTDKKIMLKVADFGIGGLAASQAIGEASRGTNRGKYLLSALQGAYTPLYASPQQMRGDAPDPRDDVFSLGVIWYQMLTGNLVTGRPGGRRWRDKLADAVPSKILDLLETCFEDDPNDRPVNAAVMSNSLGSLLGESSQQAERQPASPGKAPTVPATPKKDDPKQRPAVDLPNKVLNSIGSEPITDSVPARIVSQQTTPTTDRPAMPDKEVDRAYHEYVFQATWTSSIFDQHRMNGPMPRHPDVLISECQRLMSSQFFSPSKWLITWQPTATALQRRFQTCLSMLEKWAYYYPEYRRNFVNLWNETATIFDVRAIDVGYFLRDSIRHRYTTSSS